MFYEVIVFGSMAFWVFLIAATILFFTCSEHDDYPGGTIVALLAFFAVWLLFGDLWPLIKEHPYHAALAFPIWVVIGLGWSFPRWIILLKRAAKEYVQAKAKYEKHPEPERWENGRPIGEFPWLKSGLFSGLMYRYGFSIEDGKMVPPSFARNRGRMITWVTLWPWSMFWTVARDVVLEGIEHLVDLCGHAYQALSNWVFKGIE